MGTRHMPVTPGATGRKPADLLGCSTGGLEQPGRHCASGPLAASRLGQRGAAGVRRAGLRFGRVGKQQMV